MSAAEGVTLAGFLAARLDEDERLARQALDEAGTERETRYPYPDRLATCMHDGRHSPARVLREVEAKRRILERHRGCGSGIGYCDDGGHGWDGTDPGCAEMEDLAAPYSDHPGYDPRWKPE